jgi:hypothetical protein
LLVGKLHPLPENVNSVCKSRWFSKRAARHGKALLDKASGDVAKIRGKNSGTHEWVATADKGKNRYSGKRVAT